MCCITLLKQCISSLNQVFYFSVLYYCSYQSTVAVLTTTEVLHTGGSQFFWNCSPNLFTMRISFTAAYRHYKSKFSSLKMHQNQPLRLILLYSMPSFNAESTISRGLDALCLPGLEDYSSRPTRGKKGHSRISGCATGTLYHA